VGTIQVPYGIHKKEVFKIEHFQNKKNNNFEKLLLTTTQKSGNIKSVKEIGNKKNPLD
jgi:hypothetical protein